VRDLPPAQREPLEAFRVEKIYFAKFRNAPTLGGCEAPGALYNKTMSEETTNTPKGFRLASDPVLAYARSEEASQYVPATDPATRPEFENLGELPAGYNQMYLIARDPHWLFTYWDFDYAQFPANRQLALQVFCEGNLETTIDINELARNWYIPVQRADASYRVVFGYRDQAGTWHEVGEAGPTRTPPESVSSDWNSEFATVPFHLSFNLLLDVIEAARASGEPLVKALGELERAALKAGGGASERHADQVKILETLLGKDLLERLFSLSSGVLNSSEITAYIQRELESKLDSGAASELLARGRLAEMLAPGETSLFSHFLKAAVTAELSSAGVSSFGAQTSSAGVTSFGAETSSAEVTSFGAETSSAEVTSFGAETSSAEVSSFGAETSSAEVSSFGLETSSAEVSSFGLETSSAGVSSFGLETYSAELSSFGLASELLSSLGLSSESLSSLGLSSEVLSSFGLSSESLSSWQQEVLQSLGGVESSGALSSAALSSFGEIFSSLELLSSLSSESLLSWEKALLLAGGASEFVSLSSETLSSGAFASESRALWAGLESSFSSWSELWSESSLFSGIGASWGEQPYSERGFFMHVNAEVIFYGGTDPRAKVYIAGQPVELYPDGTFRYHFKFPDQEFEIPIIAISPDNLEARTAILSFRRTTQRQGDVGATAQPAHLTIPMGAK
jgi:hypothetical protein